MTLHTHASIAPLLAYTAAIFVSLLTAYWTQRRLDQELAQERERLEMQLQHERRHADNADLRDSLGDALVAAYRARETIVDRPSDHYGEPERMNSAAAIREMESELAKLHVRIGRDDSIAQAFVTMADCAIAMHRLRVEGAPFNMGDPTLTIWGAAYKEYIRLAQLRVGSHDQ